MKASVELYAKFLQSGVDAVEAKLLCWQSHWTRQAATVRPCRLSEAFHSANTWGTYPCISILLRIFLTLLVITATYERALSALNYLKNCLWSTMGEARLNGLAYMHIK